MKWKNFNTDNKLTGSDLMVYLNFHPNSISPIKIEYDPVEITEAKLLEFGLIKMEYNNTGTYYYARPRSRKRGVYLRSDGKFYMKVNDIFDIKNPLKYMSHVRTYKIKVLITENPL